MIARAERSGRLLPGQRRGNHKLPLGPGLRLTTHDKLVTGGKSLGTRMIDDDRVDAVGELLFGRRLRLRVLLWASEQKGAFNQSEAARGVGYNSSGEVAKELERLVQLDMVRKFGRPTRVGPQNYLRADHPGWEIADVARLMVLADGPSLDQRDVGSPAPGLADVVDGVRRTRRAGPDVGGDPSS